MRTFRALVVLALVATGFSACADATNTTTSEAAPTTSAAPPTPSDTTARQTYRHLLDGSTITQDDTNRDLAITHGTRAELRLRDDHTWSEPEIAGPGELVPVTPPDDAGYVAWELVTSGPGNLVISATGTPDCGDDDCSQEDLPFAVSIAVRQP